MYKKRPLYFGILSKNKYTLYKGTEGVLGKVMIIAIVDSGFDHFGLEC